MQSLIAKSFNSICKRMPSGRPHLTSFLSSNQKRRSRLTNQFVRIHMTILKFRYTSFQLRKSRQCPSGIFRKHFLKTTTFIPPMCALIKLKETSQSGSSTLTNKHRSWLTWKRMAWRSERLFWLSKKQIRMTWARFGRSMATILMESSKTWEKILTRNSRNRSVTRQRPDSKCNLTSLVSTMTTSISLRVSSRTSCVETLITPPWSKRKAKWWAS